MVFWLEIGSAGAGAVAAALWFRSAAGKAPPMILDSGAWLQSFLDEAGRLNRWAAGATALSVLLSAIATLTTAVQGR